MKKYISVVATIVCTLKTDMYIQFYSFLGAKNRPKLASFARKKRAFGGAVTHRTSKFGAQYALL